MNIKNDNDVDETTKIPAPPEGYAPAERFQYPMGKLQLASVLILVVTGAGLMFFLAWWHGEMTFSLGLGELLVIVLTVVVVIGVHELVHGAVYHWLGYKVSYGIAWKLGAAYAAVFGQFQQRGHNFATAVAPLLVLNTLFLPLLLVPSELLNLIGFTAILFNTSGAVGDLYLMWRLWRLPPATLMYDVTVDMMLIYQPLARA